MKGRSACYGECTYEALYQSIKPHVVNIETPELKEEQIILDWKYGYRDPQTVRISIELITRSKKKKE